MGLDFNYTTAHWSYSGFMRFRRKLVRSLGIQVDNNICIYESSLYLQVANIMPALFPLIDHSDCDGVITRDEMENLIPALTKIINNWGKDDYDRIEAEKLIDGMQKAINANDVLKFT